MKRFAKRFSAGALLWAVSVFAACNQDDAANCDNNDTFGMTNGMSCNNTPSANSIFQTTVSGSDRSITFNYIPPHEVLGNVQANQRTFTVPAEPEQAGAVTQVANTAFTGSAVTGPTGATGPQGLQGI